MEFFCLAFLLLPFFATLFWFSLSLSTVPAPPEKLPQLPPGPPRLPLIGNLHLLGSLPHKQLASLAKTYGPIMSIKLGKTPALIISSPYAAEQFLKTYDSAFACRPRMENPDQMMYGSKGIVFTNYGTQFRGLKKICHVHLLSRPRVEEMRSMRREEMAIMVEKLRRAAMAAQVVNLSAMVIELVENMTFKMVLGRIKHERFNFSQMVREAIEMLGVTSIADFLPSLGILDKGMRKRRERIMREIDDMLETIMEKHQQKSSQRSEEEDEKPCDLIESLLFSMRKQPVNLDDPANIIDMENVKAVAFDILTTAVSTSPAVIDWTLSELLRHPRAMKLTQQELRNVVGIDRTVEETDLPELSYLEMVIKEALRLNPISPLLIPRESIEETTINGYFIPKKTVGSSLFCGLDHLSPLGQLNLIKRQDGC